MEYRDARNAMLVLECKCGHSKVEHEWNVAECDLCDCTNFEPADADEYNRLSAIIHQDDPHGLDG